MRWEDSIIVYFMKVLYFTFQKQCPLSITEVQCPLFNLIGHVLEYKSQGGHLYSKVYIMLEYKNTEKG